MIGGVLVEKNAETIRKDLDTQIVNIKSTLELVQKALKTQEGVMKEWEKKYSSLLGGQKKEETNTTNTSNTKGLLA